MHRRRVASWLLIFRGHILLEDRNINFLLSYINSSEIMQSFYNIIRKACNWVKSLDLIAKYCPKKSKLTRLLIGMKLGRYMFWRVVNYSRTFYESKHVTWFLMLNFDTDN